MGNVSYGLTRNDYKKIKNMNREQLSDYLARMWKRGYDTGIKATNSSMSTDKNEG